jgi:hypothetical protein
VHICASLWLCCCLCLHGSVIEGTLVSELIQGALHISLGAGAAPIAVKQQQACKLVKAGMHVYDRRRHPCSAHE